MIISHKHKFIFIKTRKTAGTSIEIALSKICGDDDVLTPLISVDERIRVKAGYRTMQNYFIPFKHYQVRDWGRLILKRKRMRFYNHIEAKRVMQYVPQQVWRDYYKFCFERNPWDKFLSMYYFKCPTSPRPSIADFIRDPLAKKIVNFTQYAIGDDVIVDKVYRYEDLQTAFEDICEILNLTGVPDLANAKGEFRPDRAHYRDLLGDDERKYIANICAKEIELLGYEF